MKLAECLLDARTMEPCEPQPRVIESAKKLSSGEYLHVLHRMKPGVLGEILKDRGFRCHAHKSEDEAGLIELFIWQENDAAALAALHNDYHSIIPENAGDIPFLPASSYKRLTEQANEVSLPKIDNVATPLAKRLTELSTAEIIQLQEDAAKRLECPVIFRDSLQNGSDGPTMTVIPEGTFKMGDNIGTGEENEIPAHEITFSRPFAMGVYTVTVNDFSRFVDATQFKTKAEEEGSAAVWGGTKWIHNEGTNWRNYYTESNPKNPVVFVTWFDVTAYCRWLSEETGHVYRLLTEMEWEYGCRAGSETEWHFGNDEQQLTQYAWYHENSEKRPNPVGEKKPNPFGLYDMHGNITEWTDSPLKYYDEDDESAYHFTRIVRGGSWENKAYSLRSAHRCFRNPVNNLNSIMGFRLAREL